MQAYGVAPVRRVGLVIDMAKLASYTCRGDLAADGRLMTVRPDGWCLFGPGSWIERLKHGGSEDVDVRSLALTIEFGLVDAFILAVACVGFSLQFGVTNYVNFAYGSMITFGAYVAYEADSALHLNFGFALACAALACAALAWGLGRFVYGPMVKRRPQLLYALVLTFAVWTALVGLIQMVWGTEFKQLSYSYESTLTLGPLVITVAEIIFIFLGVACLLSIHVLLRYTKLGRSMRAMSDDLSLARVCGLNTQRITDITWLLTGALAGIAGVIYAMQVRAFTTSLGDTFIYLIFAAVTFGGIGRVYGAMVGAIVIGLASQLAVPAIGAALSPAVVFAVLVLLMLFRPNGLLGPTGRTAFNRA